MDKLLEVKKMIVALCAYYQHPLPDQVVEMYAKDLADLPLEKLAQAFHEIRRDPKTTRFPLPAIIRQRTEGPVNAENAAIQIAAKIPEAISKFGWNNPEKAKAFLGEVGWLIVQREGGWANLCQTVDENNLPILKAQWRQLAKSLHDGPKQSENLLLDVQMNAILGGVTKDLKLLGAN